jgi:mono/diheme cytochrome c family protein
VRARMTCVRGICAVLVTIAVPGGLALQGTKIYSIWGNPEQGQKVFIEKKCGACHAINGVGPTIGPDLARPPEHPQTITQLAGIMWNHAPEMQEVAQARGITWPQFQESEMRDLIAFIYFLRMQDRPGNARRGEQLFNEKRCSTCHALAGRGSSIGPDLSKLQDYGSPILWVEVMWRHASQMEAKMRQMGLEWPRFRDNEMMDLITYIQGQIRN